MIMMIMVIILLLLLQSALQLLWVSACSTIVEYSQQEGFTECHYQQHVKPPQLGGPVIRTFQLPPPGVSSVWNDMSEPQQRKVELWARNCREFCRKWRLPRHFWVLLRAVNLRHGTDGFTSPPKEGVLRILFARKIQRLRPGLNPRTWVPKASTLTSRPRKPLWW